MEIIDIILILILGYGGYKGYQTGLLIQVITFIAFIIAIVTAFNLCQLGVTKLKAWYDLNNSLLPVISFLIIFIGVLILIILLGRFLTSVLHQSLLGSIDQYAGALVGILKAAFGLGCVLWLLEKSGLKIPAEYTDESFVYVWLTEYSPSVIKLLGKIIPFEDIMIKVEKLIS
ncbi:CvpA family protein [Cytophaga aurantiaca]|uniref:CvpA family protein n=1 Tax=Cytophaga aurantiaca TaxID=29530 RepID=UPI000380DC44|nr:CvpA family protein [Cytophaga aurantiaca]